MRKTMKKKLYIVLILSGIMSVFMSCESSFLEKPMGSDLDVDSIFSTQQKSLTAISQAYTNSLCAGIAFVDWDGSRTYGMNAGTLSHLSGEINDLKYNWEDSWQIQHSGMTADDGSGNARSDDGFGFNYKAIRQNYLVIENIDKVVDMTQQQKDQVKAEMKTLMAYRYEEMFKRYGGVPIVPKVLSLEDNFNIPRSSLQAVLDTIVSLCNDAIGVLPNSYPDNFKGRVTKGVAMAIKAEALIYAARPLFNSPTPYMDLGANNNLICFGNYDPSRWQKAIDAAKDVINWSLSNGYHIINTGSPIDDYGTAVATPNNPEVLLAFKNQFAAGSNGNYYSALGQSGGANSMSYYQLTQYCKADGTEQTWPGATTTPYSDYSQRINAMEPRYKASAAGAGLAAWNNPGDLTWSSSQLANGSSWEGRGGTEACGRRVKFWYHAGTRTWFEFPIYRLAEFYLDLAEAYNEIGDPTNALANLNVIRHRAGLPDATDTNQSNLRKIIQREWAVEFYEEGHRLYDVKHWKLADIGNGIIGGAKKSFIFTYVNGSYGLTSSDYLTYSVQNVYTGFWSSSQYLSPFPNTEINKGYLVQNPGY